MEPENKEELHVQDKRITVTGGKGFLGSHLVRKLQERGYTQIFSYKNLMMGTQLFHENR
jgi:UDP-glucose 4-epimerase